MANGKIKAYGRLSHHQTKAIIAKSSFILFIRPDNRVSRVGFPGKVKEAFDLGVPIVTNDTGDLAKFIHHEENGFIINGFSEEAVYSQLREVLSYSNDRLNNIKRACCSKNPFNWEYFIPQTKNFLANI